MLFFRGVRISRLKILASKNGPRDERVKLIVLKGLWNDAKEDTLQPRPLES